jgi:hypothetical protein
MNAIEFKTFAQNGILKIPDEYVGWYNKTLRVILLPEATEAESTAKKFPSAEEIKAFFAAKKLDLRNYKFDREEANAR